jgi:glycosyltransferase involved in cell wall biosynthesis
MIAAALPEADFIIAGPIGAGIVGHGIDSGAFPRNVTFPGIIRREAVPEFLTSLDVGIIPYRLNEYTRGVFPLKVFEYLAAGLPVVATELPSLVGEVPEVLFASDSQSFVETLHIALEDRGDPAARERRAGLAMGRSWSDRCADALLLLEELSKGPKSTGADMARWRGGLGSDAQGDGGKVWIDVAFPPGSEKS